MSLFIRQDGVWFDGYVMLFDGYFDSLFLFAHSYSIENTTWNFAYLVLCIFHYKIKLLH